jgi:hypothetical protein
MSLNKMAGVALAVVLLAGMAGPIRVLADSPKAVEAWRTPPELMVPESVMFDAERQILYVANIAGKPTDKDDQGFIAQVTLDGAIKKLRWVEGMNAPKGMGIFQGTLYVTDIDRVHAIDIAAGSIRKTWEAPEAKFLNDIAIDPQGTVYISDWVGKVLYTISNDRLAVLLSVPQDKPNGMLMENGRLLVGTAEGVYEVDPGAKTLTRRIAHAGGIDGFKPLSPGRYIVSDWAGKTQIIEKDKPPIVLLDTTSQKVNAADLEFIAEKNLLLIPTFFDNRVAAYRLQ